MNQREALKRLRTFAKAHGATIAAFNKFDRFAKATKADSVDGCPFSRDLALDYKNKILYVRLNGKPTLMGNAIHELGHILASRAMPNQSVEWSFFYWEYRVAKLLDLYDLWDEASFDYSIDLRDAGDEGYADWVDLSPKQKTAVLKAAKAVAFKAGVITGSGQPLAIR